MKLSLTAILFILLPFFSQAQNDRFQNESEMNSFCEKITELFSQKKFSKAIDELRKYWPIPESEVIQLQEQTIRYMNMVEDRFGAVIGTADIRTETIGDFAIRRTMSVRYEYHAIRLIFTFYKSNDGWLVNSFKWDDSYDLEFR